MIIFAYCIIYLSIYIPKMSHLPASANPMVLRLRWGLLRAPGTPYAKSASKMS